MTPFELLSGRKPRTSLDPLVPLSAETEQSVGLDNFVERRKQKLREVRLALEKQHNSRVTARARANASIARPSAGAALEKGSLVLVRESESSRYRDNRWWKLQHEHYTGAWRVTDVLQTGLSMQVTMRGKKQCSRNVSTADVKPYYLRPLTLRHSLGAGAVLMQTIDGVYRVIAFATLARMPAYGASIGMEFKRAVEIRKCGHGRRS